MSDRDPPAGGEQDGASTAMAAISGSGLPLSLRRGMLDEVRAAECLGIT